MRRLVESWIEAEKYYYDNTQAQAIAHLNKRLKLRISHSRLSEWRRGKYCPSAKALSEMLWRTLPWTLGKAGLKVTDEQQNEIDICLWRFKGEGDHRTRYFL